MKIDLFHNPKSKIDLDGSLDKNFLGNELVKYVHKFAKSVTETNSKVQESRPTMRQLMTLFIQIGGVKLLMRSCRT